ncbi:helix-turn-helix domain-containing protein [uncultured Treponema sp.]|uniref:helix-turn-helix domain-containing protein n=1 Tax=uncultured Treponema sp. TaxID=162155 RepID=UPI0025E0A893|nr:helix-turn-helix transcriptional regulator [uncultured Treponema sp.]
MGFWAKVEQEREYQGLSRKELAFKANITYQGIGLGLERDSMPGADTAIKISKVLDVPIEYLVGEEKTKIQLSFSEENSDENIKMRSINLYKKNQQLIENLEKLPLSIKEPIIQMVKKLADNLEPSSTLNPGH